MTWRDSVAGAVNRVTRRLGRRTFTREELIQHEIERIIKETRSRGRTPEQTTSRVLQELRDDGQIAFLEPGEYRVLKDEVR
jgi:putative restriction endonuclease